MTHGQGDDDVRTRLEALDHFHIQQFATLVAKMAAVKEGEGTLLDNMMFTLGSGISDGSLHICTDLPTIVAGHGGGAINTNRHLKSQPGTPIANLWLAMVQLMGVKCDRIGDSTGALKLA